MGIVNLETQLIYHPSPILWSAASFVKMFLQHIKKIVKPLYQRVDVQNLPPPNTAPGLHATPAGQYPERGPKPSKFGVLFYLLSIMFCSIGIIIICRFPFIEPSERKWLLLVGLSLICVGLVSLLVTNCIVNKENRAFVHYLELKVEQYMAQWPSTRGISRPFPQTVLCTTSDLSDV